MDDLMKYLSTKKRTNGTAPKRFDECLYTPYSFTYPIAPPQLDEASINSNTPVNMYKLPEIFLFDYGVCVFWGMTLKEEQRVLQLLEPFEEEKLGKRSTICNMKEAAKKLI